MLIDTSGFLCRHFDTELYHEKAAALYESAKTRITTNYVLAEYVALALIRGLPRKFVLSFSEEILSDETIEIVWVDEAFHTKAVELIKARPDKTYSLCDVVSFIVMRDRSTTEALTTDKHFKQEGFTRLLD